MKEIPFIRLNMLLNLQLSTEEATAYIRYVTECQDLAHKMRCEFEAKGTVTPTMLNETIVKTPYPVFYEKRVILPYLDLTQKDKVVGIKVNHLTLYKNTLKSNYKDISRHLKDLSAHFGFPIECPSSADLQLFYAKRNNINATAQLLRQFGIDFTSISGIYWYHASPTDIQSKSLNMETGEQTMAPFKKSHSCIRLRPLIAAEYTSN